MEVIVQSERVSPSLKAATALTDILHVPESKSAIHDPRLGKVSTPHSGQMDWGVPLVSATFPVADSEKLH